LSCVVLYIFLSTLLSKTSRRFCSMTVTAHVSQPYVTVGRMIDLYICNLLAAFRSLFLFANKLLFPAEFTIRKDYWLWAVALASRCKPLDLHHLRILTFSFLYLIIY
jgi:hypothetical protein